jgi:flavodoxin
MKNIVLYYSKTGNSKFIAEKLTASLDCDIKRISPWFDNTFVLLLLSIFKINIPTNISLEDIRPYNNVIIIGPVWAGQLVSPLRTVLKLSINSKKNTHFAVTCETKVEDKNTKYGYNKVLNKASELSKQFVISTEAFSCSLVRDNNTPKNIKLADRIKISEKNYSNELKDLVRNFVTRIKTSNIF